MAKATDPLLKTPDDPQGIGRSFGSSPNSPAPGQVGKGSTQHRVEKATDPVLRPPDDPQGSERSFGSNPNSPAPGQTLTVEHSQWEVRQGISSPDKNGDKA